MNELILEFLAEIDEDLGTLGQMKSWPRSISFPIVTAFGQRAESRMATPSW